MLLCSKGPPDRFGTTLGSILEPFWDTFVSIFHVFRRFSMMCPISVDRCSGTVCFHWQALFLSTAWVLSPGGQRIFHQVFLICLKGALMFVVSLAGFVFITENVEEEDKERYLSFIRSSLACFGNQECVIETKLSANGR